MQVIVIRVCVPGIHAERPVTCCAALAIDPSLGWFILKLL